MAARNSRRASVLNEDSVVLCAFPEGCSLKAYPGRKCRYFSECNNYIASSCLAKSFSCFKCVTKLGLASSDAPAVAATCSDTPSLDPAEVVPETAVPAALPVHSETPLPPSAPAVASEDSLPLAHVPDVAVPEVTPAVSADSAASAVVPAPSTLSERSSIPSTASEDFLPLAPAPDVTGPEVSPAVSAAAPAASAASAASAAVPAPSTLPERSITMEISVTMPQSQEAIEKQFLVGQKLTGFEFVGSEDTGLSPIYFNQEGGTERAYPLPFRIYERDSDDAVMLFWYDFGRTIPSVKRVLVETMKKDTLKNLSLLSLAASPVVPILATVLQTASSTEAADGDRGGTCSDRAVDLTTESPDTGSSSSATGSLLDAASVDKHEKVVHIEGDDGDVVILSGSSSNKNDIGGDQPDAVMSAAPADGEALSTIPVAILDREKEVAEKLEELYDPTKGTHLVGITMSIGGVNVTLDSFHYSEHNHNTPQEVLWHKNTVKYKNVSESMHKGKREYITRREKDTQDLYRWDILGALVTSFNFLDEDASNEVENATDNGKKKAAANKRKSFSTTRVYFSMCDIRCAMDSGPQSAYILVAVMRTLCSTPIYSFWVVRRDDPQRIHTWGFDEIKSFWCVPEAHVDVKNLRNARDVACDRVSMFYDEKRRLGRSTSNYIKRDQPGQPNFEEDTKLWEIKRGLPIIDANRVDDKAATTSRYPSQQRQQAQAAAKLLQTSLVVETTAKSSAAVAAKESKVPKKSKATTNLTTPSKKQRTEPNDVAITVGGARKTEGKSGESGRGSAHSSEFSVPASKAAAAANRVEELKEKERSTSFNNDRKRVDVLNGLQDSSTKSLLDVAVSLAQFASGSVKEDLRHKQALNLLEEESKKSVMATEAYKSKAEVKLVKMGIKEREQLLEEQRLMIRNNSPRPQPHYPPSYPSASAYSNQMEHGPNNGLLSSHLSLASHYPPNSYNSQQQQQQMAMAGALPATAIVGPPPAYYYHQPPMQHPPQAHQQLQVAPPPPQGVPYGSYNPPPPQQMAMAGATPPAAAAAIGPPPAYYYHQPPMQQPPLPQQQLQVAPPPQQAVPYGSYNPPPPQQMAMAGATPPAAAAAIGPPPAYYYHQPPMQQPPLPQQQLQVTPPPQQAVPYGAPASSYNPPQQQQQQMAMAGATPPAAAAAMGPPPAYYYHQPPMQQPPLLHQHLQVTPSPQQAVPYGAPASSYNPQQQQQQMAMAGATPPAAAAMGPPPA
eukprot:gene32004-38697_t